MCVAYAIPVIGLLMWAMAAVFGLAQRCRHSRAPTGARIRGRQEKRQPPGSHLSARSANRDRDSPARDADRERHSTSRSCPSRDPPAARRRRRLPARTALLSYPPCDVLERLAAFVPRLRARRDAAQILRLDRLFGDYPSIRAQPALLAVVYHVGFWTWKQTTVGGIICQLRLVRTDGGLVRFAEALVRGLIGNLLAGRRRARLLLDSAEIPSGRPGTIALPARMS